MLVLALTLALPLALVLVLGVVLGLVPVPVPVPVPLLVPVPVSLSVSLLPMVSALSVRWSPHGKQMRRIGTCERARLWWRRGRQAHV